YPHIAQLGQLPETNLYRNVNRYDNLIQHEGMLIIRIDAQLFFANTDYFKSDLEDRLAQNSTKEVIIDAKAMNYVDSTGIAALIDLDDQLRQAGIRLFFTGVTGPVRDTFEASGIVDALGEDRFYLNVHDAVNYIKFDKPENDGDLALQSNT
ncbi:MAG: sodium-independent anion transporter, partial [Flavobacteriales bacterium]|nr:sodium-independent anion transporter [Flavobacteriales bacterium]